MIQRICLTEVVIGIFKALWGIDEGRRGIALGIGDACREGIYPVFMRDIGINDAYGSPEGGCKILSHRNIWQY